ncbi:hypothetical protein E4N62_36490 [Streptomyces sp. MNU76]|uniref:hypothetical protein n=1 Tax=Streptomyces sp. MNU76 TaxID=2560026 RepID=UPI001E625875|nr:hypothetical protein [Streptomyces sp. MNU76]MCC9710278.1 hypothetical protein [Streptomyces sp. MNU76]
MSAAIVIEEWPSTSPRRVNQRRGAVAQVVEADRRETDLLVPLDAPPCDVGGVKHLAILLGEDTSALTQALPSKSHTWHTVNKVL